MDGSARQKTSQNGRRHMRLSGRRRKMENVDLIGEDYVSRVQYWMPFTYVGEGLHDAPWRSASEFGGTTYLNNGSHGCVNLKPEVAKLLYETIEIGTPVLIYKSKPDEA